MICAEYTKPIHRRWIPEDQVVFCTERKTMRKNTEPAGASAQPIAKAEALIGFRSFCYCCIVKRAFDIVFAVVGCVQCCIPSQSLSKSATWLLAILRRFFHSTKRIGKNGKEFNFSKFRSMVVTKDGKSAEALLEKKPSIPTRIYASNGRSTASSTTIRASQKWVLLFAIPASTSFRSSGMY